MKLKNFVFPVCLSLIVGMGVTSCGTVSDVVQNTESDFISQIEEIEIIDSPLYVTFSSINEMIETTHTNHIIRCTVTERDDCTVYDPWGIYNSEDLNGDPESVAMATMFLTTPYTITVSDSYLGNLVAEDEFTFYAQYGILGDHAYRKSQYPVLETGEEYILFLRAEKINGEIVYYLTYTPDSIVKVSDAENAVTLSSNDNTVADDTSLFSAYVGNIPALENEIRRLVAENEYSTEIEVFNTVNE